MDPQSQLLTENPQVIFAWKAPLRAYKKQSGQLIRFFIAVAFLLSAIVLFFADFILIVPIFTVLFLFFILTITPPPEVTNKITTFGIESAGVAVRWESLSHFYFTKKFNTDILTIVSSAPYYFHIYLIVPDERLKKKILGLLASHIIYLEKPQFSFIDNVITALSNLIPDDHADSKLEPSHQKLQQTSPSHQVSVPTG